MVLIFVWRRSSLTTFRDAVIRKVLEILCLSCRWPDYVLLNSYYSLQWHLQGVELNASSSLSYTLSTYQWKLKSHFGEFILFLPSCKTTTQSIQKRKFKILPHQHVRFSSVKDLYRNTRCSLTLTISSSVHSMWHYSSETCKVECGFQRQKE